MLKKNQKAKEKINYFLRILLIVLIFFNISNPIYGSNNDWIEVSRTSFGIQYLDVDSLNNKDNSLIEIATKYLKLDANTSKETEEKIYIMKINCLTNKFKDISVNGKKNLSAKWEDPKKDKLINDVISYSCKNF
tara:strand:- start:403 stop:804 length:402 start_codon:yes stop_codon:yes gene_type:complete